MGERSNPLIDGRHSLAWDEPEKKQSVYGT